MQHPLRYPLKTEAGSLAAVELHRPTADDMIAIGDHLPTLMALDGEDVAKKLNASVFVAMKAVVGALTGLGDDAGRLDFFDLQEIVKVALDLMGEAEGSDGSETTGAA